MPAAVAERACKSSRDFLPRLFFLRLERISSRLNRSRRGTPITLSPCGRGSPSEARRGEGSDLSIELEPLTRLSLASLDFATLSHKGRGYPNTRLALSICHRSHSGCGRAPLHGCVIGARAPL